MTPEERAQIVVARLSTHVLMRGRALTIEDVAMRALVENHIRHAVSEEREAAAVTATSICPGPCSCGKAIAAAIRKRTP